MTEVVVPFRGGIASGRARCGERGAVAVPRGGVDAGPGFVSGPSGTPHRCLDAVVMGRHIGVAMYR